MKIDGYHGQPDFATIRPDAVGSDRARGTTAAQRTRTDSLNLSTDVELVNSAMRAATDAPEIRQDMVERAQQKLASGKLGQDLLRLADRIIDHVLTAS
jgi:anti-sigma28 factor (negative regulator of flagellin synthesis)